MADAHNRYLLISWGREMQDARLNPEAANIVPPQSWVDEEVLLQDPGNTMMGRRNHDLRGWDDSSMAQVSTTDLTLKLLVLRVSDSAACQLCTAQMSAVA